MSVLSWGKCTISHTPSIGGAPAQDASWTVIDTPKEDSTQITTTAGSEKTATEEGGAIVDAVYNKSTYQLEFDIFVKKGTSRPFVDDDGIIAGEHAFRLVPEDPACEGFQIDRAQVKCDENYSTADGKILHYTCRCLKPASGKTVKPYVEAGLTVTPAALYFGASADSTGKTITATATGNATAVSNETWCTVSYAGQVVTVKVSANEGDEARTAIVTVTADGNIASVLVTQIPA